MADLAPPLPHPSPTSAPFWEGLKQGQVRIQRCRACATWVWYPRSHCSHCLSRDLEWTTISGEGVLYTFTVARQPTAPQFKGQTPQMLAVVQLDEGPRLTSTLTGVAEEQIKVGMRLKPVFDKVTDEVTMLRYQPA
ncbi:MAG: Zn-ribbon domain-containing OB-fold protein [Acidimicrobiales bacterium]